MNSRVGSCKGFNVSYYINRNRACIPRLQKRTDDWAIRQENPVLLHPELFTTSVKTSFAEFLGAMMRRGIIVTIKPPRWPIRDIVSSCGNASAPQVLKAIVISRNASMISVNCHDMKV